MYHFHLPLAGQTDTPRPKNHTIDPMLQCWSFDCLKQSMIILCAPQGCNHIIRHLWSQGRVLSNTVFSPSDLSLTPFRILWALNGAITKRRRKRFLGHSRPYQTCKTGKESDHNVILRSARLKCNYLPWNAKLGSISLNPSLILKNTALVFDGKAEISWFQIQKGSSLWLKKSVCVCWCYACDIE